MTGPRSARPASGTTCPAQAVDVIGEIEVTVGPPIERFGTWIDENHRNA